MKRISTLTLTLALHVAAVAQTTPQVIHLWPNGAPGFESRKDIPEQAQDYWVRNVNNPSITVFLPPKEKATGAAVLIAPGGGFRELVFNAEGVQAAQFLNSIGVAAFALKYRLPGEKDSPYTQENVRQDAYRAMRLIRSRASEFNIDPHRVGILGFSAGGAVASLIAYTPGNGDPSAPDPIDRSTAALTSRCSSIPAVRSPTTFPLARPNISPRRQ
jgi:acetyl esterase/lipase